MEYLSWENWIGYAASAFVIGSFLIHGNERLMRWVNLIGAILFVAYGLIINNLPIIIPNLFLIFVQLYFLFFKLKD